MSPATTRGASFSPADVRERSTQLTLALDAALARGGTVAVIRGRDVLAEREPAMRGETSERLMPAIVEALAESGASLADIARIVCGEGPGSFTSLRIAASLAKGLADAADVPVFAAPSLALIVAGASRAPAPGRYAATLDALRGEHYLQMVQWDGASVTDVGTLERHPTLALEALALARGAMLAGPGQPLDLSPHARGVAHLQDWLGTQAAVNLEQWEPVYGRPAEAQARWEAAHGRALGQ